ncbi:MAG: rhamnulokinase [Acidobacteria bacterium]|nr:rhamnulokinase [Acidobacteriota bacterium]
MAARENYLAIDLGAGSGRVMLGALDGAGIELEELHRFPNLSVQTLDSLHWDVLRLWQEILSGVRIAAQRNPVALGVDCWGVDFALLDRTGALIGNPYCYRDARTNGQLAAALERVPREEIFESTGLQFMEINSLYQLCAMRGTPALEAAEALLMVPDLFHYWFTGQKVCELTDASTTQFYNPRTRGWARGLLERLDLPTKILQDIVPPGTQLGALRPSVAHEVGLDGLTVVAPGGHDTASAVVATPAQDADWAFVSSGTWSLLGVELPEPVVTTTTLAKNFTNEGGVSGTTRLLKNICGLWLVEECRREWARQGADISYQELISGAKAAPAFRTLLDVDDPSFVAPGDMPQRIRDYCERTGQPSPETPGQFGRAIFESLALKYRLTLADLAEITGRTPRTLHIVGGGSQNRLLCQYAANACGVEVVAGPVEATALGNVLVQAMGLGRVSDLAQAREVVRRSFKLHRYEPERDTGWHAAANRLAELIAPVV